MKLQGAVLVLVVGLGSGSMSSECRHFSRVVTKCSREPLYSL